MITIIFGENGKGKTCYMTYIGNERAFDRERNRAMQRAIRIKNKNGFNLTVPQHAVAANYSVTFHKTYMFPRQARIVNPFRLGFQNGSPYKMHFTLPYETILIDEAQKYFPNRDNNFPSYRSNFYEENRHNDLDIYLATPDAILIHKNVRRLAQGIYIDKMTVREDRFGKVNITWVIHRIPAGYIDQYLEAAPKEREGFYVQEKIVAPYNVFALYDAKGCNYRFYEGHFDEDFDLNYESAQPVTIEEYKDYVSSLDDSKPDPEEEKNK